MKTSTRLALSAIALFLFSAIQAATIVVSEGVIESDENWTSDNTYVLEGFVAINAGVTVTIDAGTIIMGDTDTKGTLIVMQGGRLVANGESGNPVVFTSDQPVGSRSIGDWGGIVMLGNAPINVAGGVNTIEGGIPSTLVGKTSGNTITDVNIYGGSSAADDSGVLTYVRIEYCGVAFSLDNEINGLTMGGVGSGTEIDYVQVSFCGDDSFEWFGGTVNCKHLIAWKGTDDNWDSDFGFSGDVQFGLGVRDANTADAAGSSNGFESNNDGDGTANTPLTEARFVNFTEVGPIQNSGDVISTFFARGVHKRGNSHASILNSIIMGYPDGIELDACNVSDATRVESNIFAGNDVAYDCDVCPPCELPAASDGNMDYAATSDVGLTDPYAAAPDFRPTSGSAPLTNTDVDGIGGTIEDVEYIGAFGESNDWTADWAEWDPQNVDYSGTVGIEDILSSSVNIFPNPASSSVSIQFENVNDIEVVEVMNTAGQLVFSFRPSSSVHNVQTADWANGLYLVQISYENGLRNTQRIAIEH